MVLLYTALVLLLVMARLVVGRRAAGLARKYAASAKAANEYVHGKLLREGNSGKVADAYQYAKRQYLLGLMVQKRDRLEAKHDVWLARHQALNRAVNRLRGWKGRKLPYTLGVLDVSGALYLIDYLGAGKYVSVRPLVELVQSYLTQ